MAKSRWLKALCLTTLSYLGVACGTDGAAASGSETGGAAGTERGTGGGGVAGGGGMPEGAAGGAPGTGGTAPGGAGGSSGGGTGGAQGGATYEDPGVPVSSTDPVPEALREALATAQAMDGQDIVQAYPAPAAEPLGYDATTAQGFELIQSSALALNAEETERLNAQGLVIVPRQSFPSFAYGYKTIYSQDLPVYVSADSILEAVHRTFDALLKATEEQVLIDQLGRFLEAVRSNVPGRVEDSEVSQDVDLYLTVALGLLRGSVAEPIAGADADAIAEFHDMATKGEGYASVELFGATRDEDFSQFKPRGHYTDTPELERYFRAMMWLGRVDLRIVETQPDGTQLFRRRQFDAAVALNQLMESEELALWAQIDATIGAFVGEHDNMTPKDMDGLLDALAVASAEEAARLPDDAIIAEIARGGWGAQRIASRIIYRAGDAPLDLPLDRSYRVFGQRYTVDSHAFVNVTHDRVAGRMMPKPLDAAFAALGNNGALPLLGGDLDDSSYAAGLAKTRTLVDAHEAAYWEGSLYTRWLGALRTLSPDPNTELGGVTRTDGWNRRMLAAQLGSWAELRHDTILYAKQSYTSGEVCEFPDAYVDPYPEFYARLGALAGALSGVADNLPATADELKNLVQDWASRFSLVTANLETMAQNQLSGTPHSQELMDFINDAVKWDEMNVCGSVSYSNLAGWYLRLYLYDTSGLEYDPVVADVHTQPTDEAGNDVGRILHVGTGMPRLMVVTAETCEGPRAYAGLAFSYGELITEHWQRLNDQEWKQQLAAQPFPDPEWMGEVMGE